MRRWLCQRTSDATHASCLRWGGGGVGGGGRGVGVGVGVGGWLGGGGPGVESPAFRCLIYIRCLIYMCMCFSFTLTR